MIHPLGPRSGKLAMPPLLNMHHALQMALVVTKNGLLFCPKLTLLNFYCRIVAVFQMPQLPPKVHRVKATWGHDLLQSSDMALTEFPVKFFCRKRSVSPLVG